MADDGLKEDYMGPFYLITKEKGFLLSFFFFLFFFFSFFVFRLFLLLLLLLLLYSESRETRDRRLFEKFQSG
jgi:hypothetical protein